jgi:hypothetical protein
VVPESSELPEDPELAEAVVVVVVDVEEEL